MIVKLNSLVDQEIIEKLYEASCAGVKIDLIVRGICSLRPKVPGLSENIRVVSIVGRFLEHSRVYFFANAGEPEVYLASADWMPRNFVRRVEIAFPIEDPALRDEIINEVLPNYLTDHVKARELQPDGTYIRLKPQEGETPSQVQLHFRERSRRQIRKLAESRRDLCGRKTDTDHHGTRRTSMKKTLVVDIGGTNVKLMISREEKRKFESGPKMTPKQMVKEIEKTVEGWDYDAISVGFPSTVRDGKILKDPKHLGPGWVNWNPADSLGKPVRCHQRCGDAGARQLSRWRTNAFSRPRNRPRFRVDLG